MEVKDNEKLRLKNFDIILTENEEIKILNEINEKLRIRNKRLKYQLENQLKLNNDLMEHL